MNKSRRILAPRRPWSSAEDALLIARYPHEPTPALARALGRHVGTVYQRAYKLGLAKTAEFLSSEAGGRLQPGDTRGGATRFKKGHVSHNKGKAMPASTYALCAPTMFKPGRPAHEARNYVPIGSLKITKDGYVERKVTDDPSIVPARRWVPVHRLVWMEANGPIPPGHAVVFRPGRMTTDPDQITVDGLELVTRRELMRRNTVHNLPKPLAELVQLRGALVRQINRRTKREDEDHRPA